jgi:hypothetical protein
LQREAEAILERHRARIANERETQGELDTEIPVIEGRDIWGSTEKVGRVLCLLDEV